MKTIIVSVWLMAAMWYAPAVQSQENQGMSSIPKTSVEQTIASLVKTHGETARPRIEKGVTQAASFWIEKDGSAKDFEDFCIRYFAGSEAELGKTFDQLSVNFEVLFGHLNKISLDLKRPVHLEGSVLTPLDELFGGYDPSAHLTDDFFNNKIAFAVILNFPSYSLKEKTELAPGWSRRQWAYARMGDIFTSRVPAEMNLKYAETLSAADNYISHYNIYMGHLLDNKGKTLFDKDLRLITHWGLRDELKSHYAGKDGLVKQRMVYEVMKRIIHQDIPSCVIGSPDYDWNPIQNKVYKDGKEVATTPEPNTRYSFFLNNFKAVKAMDPYYPQYENYIQRRFDSEMEIAMDDVETLFTGLLSSPQVRRVGALIGKRLGRKLEAFDIWYDGFKSRSAISQEELSKTTRARYPTKEAFEADLSNILLKLGFDQKKAEFIMSKVAVDASRGAGHAWGAQMKSEKSRLRTRVGENGMDYKGYNIAVHEFGHNVEQTISLHDIDYYILNGVPNTAFTEAMAFCFQARDLELLGITNQAANQKHLDALDDIWSTYEIMGVSLVDIRVWKWLYANPNATPEQLRDQVIAIAKEIWNLYYADVFGIKDQPILAIYSHMIDYPLYLPAYPIGHVIDFQFERYVEGRNLAQELQRVLVAGRILPQLWMKNAVGREISTEPLLKAADEALNVIK